MRVFPPGFLFGTATSATQVEGHCTTTDWYEFARAGRVKGGARLDVAADFWNRWPEDVALQRALGMSAARLSLEWGRIEPRPGAVDRAALEHYRAILGAHVDAGIRPMVTLHHFALPTWMADRGGLLAPELPERLARFARVAFDALGDLASHWITVNEPNVLVAHAHVLGVWPPAHASPVEAVVAHHRLLEAHVRMYRALHDADRQGDTRVGVAHHLRPAEPRNPRRAIDRLASRVFNAVFNESFARALARGELVSRRADPWLVRLGAFDPREARGTQDFLGVNYYSRDRLGFDPRLAGEMFIARDVPPGAEKNDLGWEIYPDGLLTVLETWSRRTGGLPVYVTENGVADARDALRPRFLVRHLARVAEALARGIDVQGYYHWSLLDNFEWAEGYAPRFGLVAVDYATGTRTPRPSAEVYGRIARARAIDEATWRELGDGPRAPRATPSVRAAET